jgi:hypothetical protein
LGSSGHRAGPQRAGRGSKYSDRGIASICFQGIENAKIIDTVGARRGDDPG